MTHLLYLATKLLTDPILPPLPMDADRTPRAERERGLFVGGGDDRESERIQGEAEVVFRRGERGRRRRRRRDVSLYIPHPEWDWSNCRRRRDNNGEKISLPPSSPSDWIFRTKCEDRIPLPREVSSNLIDTEYRPNKWQDHLVYVIKLISNSYVVSSTQIPNDRSPKYVPYTTTRDARGSSLLAAHFMHVGDL